MLANTDVTVIVCTHNRAALLGDTLECLLAQDYQNFAILVVDNNSTDDTKAIVQRFAPRIKYCFEARTGISLARNRALAEVSSNIIVFCDDDCRTPPNWLTQMVAPIAADPTIACVGCRVLPDWEQEPPRWFPKQYYPLLALYDPPIAAGPPPDGACFPGATMAFNRRALKGFPFLFDPTLGINGTGQSGYNEDTMLLAMLAKKGYKLHYNPLALAYHFLPAARLSKQIFKQRLFRQGESDRLMFGYLDSDYRVSTIRALLFIVFFSIHLAVFTAAICLPPEKRAYRMGKSYYKLGFFIACISLNQHHDG